MNLGTMWVTLGVNLQQMDKAVSSLNTVSQRFRTFGYLASAAVTVPLVAAGKATFKMASDYEYSMQKIVGLTGVAQSAVDSWSKELLAMGPKLAKSPQELAEALYFISSSGIKGAEAMDVLALSAKAASSGLGQTQTIADVLTSALNAYAGTGLTAAYATDSLIAAVRVGKAEGSGFASSLGQIIPIAAEMGVSFDQVAGGMAAITLSGASASNAAVYLKGVFQGLNVESGKGREAMDGMNTSYGELRKILREQGLIALMQKLRDMSADYGDTLYTKVFPNIRATLGVLSIAGKNFKYNSEIMKEVTNSSGSLNAAWAAVSDTIKIRFDRAISTANVSMITLGKSVAEAVIPFLEGLVRTLGRLTAWFDSLTEAQKRNKIIWLGIIAALGPASLLISLVGYSLSAFVSIAKGAIIVLNALKVAIMTNPIGLLITGLLAAGVAFMLFAKKGKSAADAQTALNDAMSASDVVREGSKSIDDRMAALAGLDKRQLETLKNDIDTRVQLEKDFQVTLLAVAKEGIKNDKFILAEKEKIWKAEDHLQFVKKAMSNGAYKDEEVAKTQAKINQANKAINDYKANIKNIREYDQLSVEASIGLYTRYGQQVSSALNAIIDPVIKAEKALKEFFEEQEKIAEALGKLGEGELYINRMTKLLGSEFDTAKAKTELYNSVLEELANTTLPLTDARMKDLVTAVKLMNDVISPIKKQDYSKALGLSHQLIAPKPIVEDFDLEVLKKLELEFEQISLKEAWMGAAFDDASMKAGALEVAIDALNQAYPEGGAPIEDLVAQYNSLIEKQEAVAVSARKMGNAMANSMMDMALAIGTAFVDMKAGATAMVDIILNTGQQIIQMLMAEAAATLLLATATMIQKQVATKQLIGLAIAAVGIGIMMALWGKAKANISTAAKLAHGGVIPEGYPNDSFPAMLSSGEEVRPRSVRNLERQSSVADMLKDVVFHVEGDELVGVFKNHSRKTSSYA